jgi:hypothetical protein
MPLKSKSVYIDTEDNKFEFNNEETTIVKKGGPYEDDENIVCFGSKTDVKDFIKFLETILENEWDA